MESTNIYKNESLNNRKLEDSIDQALTFISNTKKDEFIDFTYVDKNLIGK